MLKRAWLLVSIVWALVFLWNGSTKLDGVGDGDVMMAAAPLAIGWLLVKSLRFIATGSFRKPRTILYR